jgi:hypothetical protein
MIGKKINQLATELAPASTDLTIIGNPTTGVSKKITLAQLGAIFSGAVSFYTDLASFPTPGTTDVIYCAKDTQKLYLWSGSAYVEVFPSQALLDTYQLRSEKGNANGYASLDSGGKVPISQLPSSIMEYKGTWNASTNTPTLANGTGDTGDVYICNVAGTVNFGAGPLTFAVGDYVIYSGTIWQRSSGAVGTVTSVALTVGGDAISVSGSPLTTSGTLALAFSGTTSQYIRGNGTLANFPTSLVSGTGTQNRITKWSFTSGEIVDSSLVDTGGSIYNTLTNPGQFSWQFNGDTSTGLSFGALIVAGTDASDIALRIQNASSTSVYFYVWGDGRVQINNIPNATTDTDRFLVSDSGVIKYRTGAELLSDIGGASASGYVPYTGAMANLDLGTHTLIAAKGTFSSSGSGDTVGITHSSGSGIALNITKGGNGEGLYINKTSGTGNAATIIGTLNATTLVKSGGTSAQFLKADGSVDSTSYGTGSVTSVGLSSATSGISIFSTPITTSGTITIDISTASASGQGLLSSTDWTTFNNKQNALTNPVTGTGTTNYLPKFTGASTIGNSAITDDGTTVSLLSRALSGTSASFSGLVSGGNTSPSTSYNAGSWFTGDGLVAGNISSVCGIQINSSSTSTLSAIRFGDGDGANNLYDQGFIIYRHTTDSMLFGTNRGTALTINASGNLGLGVTPSAWDGTLVKAIQLADNGASLSSFSTGNTSSKFAILSNNAYYDSGGWKYLQSAASSQYRIANQEHQWLSAGSGTAGNSISFTQAMTLDASGRLGIGTTSPTEKLDVIGGAVAAGNGTIRTGITYSSLGLVGTFTNHDLGVITNGNERMRITSAGNVGIGTSPQWGLSGYTAIEFGNYGLLYASTSSGASTTLGNNLYHNGSNWIYKNTNGGSLIAQNGGTITFETASSGTAGTTASITEKMRISSGGDLLVGTTDDGFFNGSVRGIGFFGSNGFIAASRSGAVSAIFGRFTSTGDVVQFRYNGSAVGTISVTGSATAYNTSSDYRLKQDLKDFNGLDLLTKIKTYDYEWKSDKSRSYGVIAHELQSVINYAVTGVKDGKEMQGVDYSKIVPVLIKAIQELNDKIK